MGKKKQPKKAIPKKKVKKKKVKIKYRNVLLFLLILLLLGYGIYALLRMRITNIYIQGNTYLSDQEIIEKADVASYPTVLETLSFFLEKKLTQEPLLAEVKISHKNIRELHIKVVENRPLFYNSVKEEVVLKDGKTIKGNYPIPVLLNYVPDKKYKIFKQKMQEISTTILGKISEIKYDPNDKDDERFLLSMNDGNYVYLSLSKFNKIDSYLDIMLEIEKKFDQKKGILYLDSGGYFEVLEN